MKSLEYKLDFVLECVRCSAFLVLNGIRWRTVRLVLFRAGVVVRDLIDAAILKGEKIQHKSQLKIICFRILSIFTCGCGR